MTSHHSPNHNELPDSPEAQARHDIAVAEAHGFVREPSFGSAYEDYLLQDGEEARQWLRQNHPEVLAPNGRPWGDEPFDLAARHVAERLRHSPGCTAHGGYAGIPCSCGLDDRLLELGLYSDR